MPDNIISLDIYNLSTYALFVYNLSTSLQFDSDKNARDNATVGHSVVAASLPMSTKQYAINITYILVALFGVLGNLLSLTIICTHPPLRKKLPNYYYINQTVADLFVCILLVPSVTVGLISYGYSTTPLCLIWQSRALFVGLYDVSVYSIVALSVERYLEVVYPIWHKLNVTKTKVKLTIVGTWIFAIAFKFTYISSTTRAVNGVCLICEFYPSAFVSSAAGLLDCFVAFLFPLFIIFLCYILMWRKLQTKVKPHSGPTRQSVGTTSNDASMSRARRNILTTLFIVVAFLIVCNSYKQTLIVLKFLHVYAVDLGSVFFNISQILSFMNATIEPYIYLSYHREFQAGFRKLFKMTKVSDLENSRQTKSSGT